MSYSPSRGWSRLRLLLLLSFSTGACAAHFPPCPASGGPTWRELSSDHFRLRTDFDLDDARVALRELEDLRAALLTCFRARVDLPTGRVPVIAVREGWGDFADDGLGGFFTNALFSPLVVLRAGDSIGRQEAIKHELVHYLSQKVIPTQPPWFAEGLADYFRTIEYDPDEHRITVGRPPADLLRVVRQGGLLDVADMLATTSIHSDDRGLFYPSAWFMVHYLMNHRAAALAAYGHALLRSSAQAAWAEAFAGLSAKQLDLELGRYLDGGQYALLIYRFDPPATPIIEERTLTDADVHATRALLLALASRVSAMQTDSDARDAAKMRARLEIAEAFRQEPAHLLAQGIEHWMLGARTHLDEARAATKSNPTHWMAWALLVEALQEHHIDEGRTEAFGKTLDLADADPAVNLQRASLHSRLPPP